MLSTFFPLCRYTLIATLYQCIIYPLWFVFLSNNFFFYKKLSAIIFILPARHSFFWCTVDVSKISKTYTKKYKIHMLTSKNCNNVTINQKKTMIWGQWTDTVDKFLFFFWFNSIHTINNVNSENFNNNNNKKSLYE